MDGRWDFTAGLPDLSGPSGTPYQDMLNMPGFEEPVQPAPTHAFEPGSRQGGSGKPRKKTVSRPKQNNFSIEEDKNLVSSWLNVSLDPVKGAGQRKSSFWKAIEQNYNAQKGPMYPIRTLRSLEGRWSDIKEQANKFESHYNNILNERRSGYSDMDKIAAAIELYNSLEDRPFTTIHCWEMLRNEPKWMDLNNHGKQDRGRVPEDVNAPIDVTESGCGEAGSESQIGTSKRPPGRDISRSGKWTCSSGSPSDAGSEFSSMLSAMHIQKMDLIRTFDDCVASKMDRLVTIQEKNIELKKKKDAREQELRDERIMAIDLTTCNPGQRVLYEAMQREILQRWAARNEDAP